MMLKRENTLSQLVLESIQASIRDGEFRPGETLPSERALSERYGVGKSSVREAIKMLQVLGVVESAQGKGTYLRESVGHQILRPLLLDMMLHDSTAKELYELRLMFDKAYIALASSKASGDQKERARKAFEHFCHMQGRSHAEAERYDLEFHTAMLEATGNQLIIKIGTLIMELCRPYISRSNLISDDDVVENHKKILEIFCSGDTAGLDEAVEKSLIIFRNTLDERVR